MSEIREAVDAHVDALNHGDLAQILASFTPDARFVSAAGQAVGRAQLAGLFDTVVGDQRPITIIRGAVEVGRRLRCTMTRRFEVRDEVGRVAGSQDVEVQAVFTVSDGLIAAVEVQLL